jgi:hypothetical protein
MLRSKSGFQILIRMLFHWLCYPSTDANCSNRTLRFETIVSLVIRVANFVNFGVLNSETYNMLCSEMNASPT